MVEMARPIDHPWEMPIAEAERLQRELAGKVSDVDDLPPIRLVAGVDLSGVRSGVATAAAVLLSFPELLPVEESKVQGPLRFPYIPGFLSFREAPLMMEALRGLSAQPDVVLVDGQGRAHPRGLGIASHLGVLLEWPTIGCAKSRLVGRFEPPEDEPGASSLLVLRGEAIGAVLRTRGGVKPIFVSVGHRVSLATALGLVMQCTVPGRRIPEPTRLAHLAAGSKE
jgi:deoxyribonuclease V